MGSSLRSGRDCRWGEWITSTLSTFNTTTEVRPLSKAPNPQLLPGRRSIGSGCMFTTVCVHLDGLNAEHKFRVWVTILGHTPLPFPFERRKSYTPRMPWGWVKQTNFHFGWTNPVTFWLEGSLFSNTISILAKMFHLIFVCNYDS